MSEQTSLGNLGEAKVLIRADWEKFDDDVNKGKLKLSSAFEKSGQLMKGVGTALTAGLTAPLAGLISVSTLAASRVNELERVNTLLGNSAGYATDYIREQEDKIQRQGIEAAASREIIADYIKAELDLADASKIARVAQDAAVISGANSTDTTKTLTQAIITGRTELFKSAGMIVDLNSAYKDYAALTGDATRELTEQEKVQARVNATLEYGERIAGAYLAAMDDPGKVLRSYPRYLNDVAVAFGQNFIPAFSDAIFAGKNFLEWLRDAVSEGGALNPVIKKWGERFEKAAEFVGDFTDRLDDMDPAMLQSITDFIAMGAAMGPVLLVGGQLLIWIPKAVSGFNALAGSLGLTATGFGAILLPLGMLAAAGVSFKIFYDQISENTRATEEHNDVLADVSATYEGYIARTRIANGEQERSTGLILNTNSALGAGMVQLEGYSKQIDAMSRAEWYLAKNGEEIAEKTQAWADANYESEDAMLAAKAASDKLKQSAEAAQETLERGFSITGNFDRIISTAQSYDQILGEIDEKQNKIKQLNMISQSGGFFEGVYLSAEEAREQIQGYADDIDDLQARMAEMANQMVLDLFKVKITADGVVSDAEMGAYFKLAENMGLISEEAANAAILAYQNAIDEINDMEIDDKTGNIDINVSYHDPVGYVTGVVPKPGGINLNGTTRAGGGELFPLIPTLVGERGPEVVFPMVGGSVLSTEDMMAALKQPANITQTYAPQPVDTRDYDLTQLPPVVVYATVNNEIDMHVLARTIMDEQRRSR